MYWIAIILGIISLVVSFTGLPGSLDSEPILAIGLILLAYTGLMKD